MASIYGWYGHNGAATRKPIRRWKHELMQLFGTIRTAIEKNVTGDDRHKENMMEHCTNAVDAIRDAKSKEQIANAATQFAFKLIFKLLGRLPHNREKRRAHHSRVTDLSAYRTLSYTRTAHQKVKEIIDYAPTGQLGSGEPTSEVLIKKLTRDFSHNPHKFLSWVKTEHRSLYDRFN
ncbi:MAG: hypothetical protein AABY46_05640 [Nitrospirota bacterium]